jgi:phage terminase large subunit
MWWMEEATEFDEDDFNIILRAMRGNKAGWNQIIMTTNPGSKLHWINRRMIIGEESAYYPSHAHMNPYNDPEYVTITLPSMTGVIGKRLYKGLWTDGIGTVIDPWVDDHSGLTGIEPIGNVTPSADYIPGYGRVVWYVDDGYGGQRDKKTKLFTEKSNPRTFLLVQERKDGTIAIFAEHLEVQVLADTHIEMVEKLSKQNGWPAPQEVIYDGAAPALGGEFKRAKYRAKPVRCKIDDGLDELRSWVGPDRNGVRRLIVHPRCQYVRWEMGAYIYDENGNPIDAFNHTIDGLRYGVWRKSHGPSQQTQSMAHGVDREKIDEKVAEIYARVREKYENAIA